MKLRATTVRSPGLRNRSPPAAPQATGAVSILRSIWPDAPASFSATVTVDFEPLFDPQRKEQPITPAFCYAHARRGFFELADIAKKARDGKKGKPISPIALEAVRRLDALFEIERAIDGRSADERYAVRQEKSKPLLADLPASRLHELLPWEWKRLREKPADQQAA